MKLGFVGLGAMGGRLASRLVTVGDLTVYDKSETAMEPFRGRAAIGSTIADAATEADVVGVCVRDDAQVNDCVDGLLPAMKRGSILMIHSTVGPETVRAAARRGAEHGVDVIDATVTSTGHGASADGPFVFVMLGGDPQIAERVRPLTDAYGTDTIGAGPVGAAAAMKIINNLVSLSEIVIAEEAFRLAMLTGVSVEGLLTVMRRNGALTPTMRVAHSRTGQPGADVMPLPRRMISAGNSVKDFELAEALAQSVHTPSPVATFGKEHIWNAYMTNLPPS
jgi:3-hydroxyisobutyrate dehydrogenase